MDVHPPKYSKIGFDTSPYVCVYIRVYIADLIREERAKLCHLGGIGVVFLHAVRESALQAFGAAIPGELRWQEGKAF